MKKPIGKNSHISLINEYKGNLFEFMVGSELSRLIDFEHEYINSIAPNFHQLLRNYQNYILEHDEKLAIFLAEQARVLASFLMEKINAEHPGTVWSRVGVVGKVAANDQALGSEADIIIESSEITVLISLKISKKGSFLNTKSAGIRSCLSKYFDRPDCQEKLNQLQDLEFSRFSQKLEELSGLIPSQDFSSWKQDQRSQLPGELKDEERVILEEYYAKLLECFSAQVLKIKDENPAQLKTAVRALCGFEGRDISQVVLFYDRDSEDNYRHQSIEIHQTPSLDDTLGVRFDGGNTSIYIQNTQLRLQLRIKPMNVFTTKAIKINSSVRYSLLHD